MKIVIKVGTQAILASDGSLKLATVARIVEQIATLKSQGHQVILVSSGAVGCGRKVARELLGVELGSSIADKQVLASLGQPQLMQEYAQQFQAYGIAVAQLLLTKQDFHTRQHYCNIERLLQNIIFSESSSKAKNLRDQQTIIPIINENDSVAIAELMFTDNDELAGLISAQIGADKLIILTSVRGVYDGPPEDPNAKIIPVIDLQNKLFSSSEDSDFTQQMSLSKTPQGRGGIISKLATARKMADLGITTYIAHVDESICSIIAEEGIGTKILPCKKKSSLKRRLAFNYTKNAAIIYINDNFLKMLTIERKIASILPIGIEKVSGDFEKGDLVDICSPAGRRIGSGIAKYSAKQLQEYLSQYNKPVFIHYNDLYIEPN